MAERIENRMNARTDPVAMGPSLDPAESARIRAYLDSLRKEVQPDGSIQYFTPTPEKTPVAIIYPAPDGNDILYFLDQNKVADQSSESATPSEPDSFDTKTREIRLQPDDGLAVKKSAERFAAEAPIASKKDDVARAIEGFLQTLTAVSMTDGSTMYFDADGDAVAISYPSPDGEDIVYFIAKGQVTLSDPEFEAERKEGTSSKPKTAARAAEPESTPQTSNPQADVPANTARSESVENETQESDADGAEPEVKSKTVSSGGGVVDGKGSTSAAAPLDKPQGSGLSPQAQVQRPRDAQIASARNYTSVSNPAERTIATTNVGWHYEFVNTASNLLERGGIHVFADALREDQDAGIKKDRVFAPLGSIALSGNRHRAAGCEKLNFEKGRDVAVATEGREKRAEGRGLRREKINAPANAPLTDHSRAGSAQASHTAGIGVPNMIETNPQAIAEANAALGGMPNLSFVPVGAMGHAEKDARLTNEVKPANPHRDSSDEHNGQGHGKDRDDQNPDEQQTQP